MSDTSTESDLALPDSAPADTGEAPRTTESETLAEKNRRGPSSRRQITVSVPALVGSLVIVVLIAATAVFAVRDLSARNDLETLRSQAADEASAKDVAGKYAVAAATLDYQDLNPWITAMKKGVTPELSRQYDAIGQAMGQVMTPLQMKTTAELVTVSVDETSGDLYRVDAVVDLNISTVQNPGGSTAVAVYQVVLDRSKDWMITEVGDPTNTVAGALGPVAGTPKDAAQTETQQNGTQQNETQQNGTQQQPAGPQPGAPTAPTPGN